MKKILAGIGYVVAGVGGCVAMVAQNSNMELPLWAAIIAILFLLTGSVIIFLAVYTDKAVPQRKATAAAFAVLPLAAIPYVLRHAGLIDMTVSVVIYVALLFALVTWALRCNEEDTLAKDKDDDDETTQPLPDVDDDDVTVVSGEEAVVVEDDSIEFPKGATLLVLDENGNPELDEVGKLQFYDDEGHRIYGVSALGTVTQIKNDSIVITKEDGNTITVHSNGSVEGDIPDSLYVPSPDNKEGWRNVYQGIRERLEEDPFKK